MAYVSSPNVLPRRAGCLPGALFVAVVATQPAAAAVKGGCMDDLSGGASTCTANDVTVAVVGLGSQQDGCVHPADTVELQLEATIRNTTSRERYDLGLFVAVDGDPNGDGARTGACVREVLQPVGAQGVETCDGNLSGSLDLLRRRDDVAPFDGEPDNGPYLNLDGDACGDLRVRSAQATCDADGDGAWDDTVLRLAESVTLPCDDVDRDGRIEIPTCLTWGSSADQVGGTSCDGAQEAAPGTPSKCQCQSDVQDVPVPELSLSGSAPEGPLGPGEAAPFSVTYENASTCSPDPSRPERTQCGTASHVFFVIEYDAGKGTVANIQPPPGATVFHDATRGRIVWIPASDRTGTGGVVGPGDTGTLSYEFTYTANRADDTVTTGAQGYWTDDPALLGDPDAPGVVAQPTLTYSTSVSATPVTLSSARVVHRAGVPVLEWSTATESSNLGFHVYVDGRDGWERVTAELIPSQRVDSTAPTEYSLELEGFQGPRYAIEDVALDGTRTLHGPFRRTKGYGTRPEVEAVEWAEARAEAEAPRGRPGLALRKGGPGGGSSSPGPVRLLVNESGVQRVTYEDLAAAGFDFAGVPSKHLAVTLRGEPVPVRVEPAAGRFGPGSYVELVGEALDTLYTRTNVYELRRDVHAAVRMPEDPHPAAPDGAVEATPHALEIERDRHYSFASPGDDPWYDTRMIGFAGRPKSWRFPVELPGHTGEGPVSLSVRLWGVTSWPEEGDHHAVVSWNGRAVGEAVWDGLAATVVEAELPTEAVIAGSNELAVELPGNLGVPWDVVDLESYAVRYPRELAADGDRGLVFTGTEPAYRVRSLSGAASGGAPSLYRVTPDGPVHLTGVESEADGSLVVPGLAGVEATYHVATASSAARPGIEAAREPSGLADGPAEYLVISHGAFLDALDPLVAHREARGLSVEVVDVEDVYARYSAGVFDPEAIRSYVADAVAELGTRFVLLVGGDTFDYHDRLGLGSVSFIPSLYTVTGEIVRWAPSDPLLADVDDDGVPDVPIGRLPVRSRSEADAVVEKILAYERKGYGKTAVLAADAQDASSRFSFSQASEAFARSLPEGWSVERAYVDTLGAAGARQRLVTAVSGGRALTAFMGHSGLTHWTFSGLLRAGDVASLDNAGEPTVVVQWGCWNTYHVEPRFQTLGHRFLLTEERGAAAVLGSATLLETSSADALSRRMAPLLARPGTTLGEAVTEAKRALAASEPERRDALLGWTLLGDPAMAVAP